MCLPLYFTRYCLSSCSCLNFLFFLFLLLFLSLLVNNVKAYFLIIFRYDRNAICKSIWRKKQSLAWPCPPLMTLVYTSPLTNNLSPILHKRDRAIIIIEHFLFSARY